MVTWPRRPRRVRQPEAGFGALVAGLSLVWMSGGSLVGDLAGLALVTCGLCMLLSRWRF